MIINYKSTVDNAESWRLTANDETFIPFRGEVNFTIDIETLLKVVYKISAPNNTEIIINYTCENEKGETFKDDEKKSPHSKPVPESNETQVTLNISLD